MGGALFFLIWLGVLILLRDAFRGEAFSSYDTLCGISLLVGAVFFIGSPFIFDPIDEDVGFEATSLVPVIPGVVFAYYACVMLAGSYTEQHADLFTWMILIMGVLLAVRYPTFKIMSLAFILKAGAVILFIASSILLGWPGLQVFGLIALIAAGTLAFASSMMLFDEWEEYREKIREKLRRTLGRR